MSFYIDAKYLLPKCWYALSIPLGQIEVYLISWFAICCILDSSSYAHYVFNAFDQDNKGIVNFEVSADLI